MHCDCNCCRVIVGICRSTTLTFCQLHPRLHIRACCVLMPATSCAGRPGEWVAKLADFGLHATVEAQERDEKIRHLCVSLALPSVTRHGCRPRAAGASYAACETFRVPHASQHSALRQPQTVTSQSGHALAALPISCPTYVHRKGLAKERNLDVRGVDSGEAFRSFYSSDRCGCRSGLTSGSVAISSFRPDPCCNIIYGPPKGSRNQLMLMGAPPVRAPPQIYLGRGHCIGGYRSTTGTASFEVQAR